MNKVDALFVDSFHDSEEDAIKEAHSRKLSNQPSITTVGPSSYGGRVVRSIPAEFAIDLIADSVLFGTNHNKRAYG